MGDTYIIIIKIIFEVILKLFLLFFLFIFSFCVNAAQTCSRIATINYQEVLVDSNSSEKGEGLRFHLEKDPVALEYLNKYQKGTGLRWQNAILGTAGTGLLLYGVFNSDSEDRKVLVGTGVATLFVNYLISRTLELSNETNLNKAIEEYNKRNLPKIFFTPEETRAETSTTHFQVGLTKVWSF